METLLVSLVREIDVRNKLASLDNLLRDGVYQEPLSKLLEVPG